MLLTDEGARQIQHARWSVPRDVQATLDYEVSILTVPESNGISKLERIYKTCDFEEQRRQEVITAIFAKFKNQHEDAFVWVFADTPDDGDCVFFMKVAETQAALAKAPTARRAFNLNLLRPVEEWAIQPAVFVAERSPPRPGKARP